MRDAGLASHAFSRHTERDENRARIFIAELLADGAERHRGAVIKDVNRLRAAFDQLPDDRAGIRITGIEFLKPVLASAGSIGSIATAALGKASRPVRAILFDKNATTNWALAWHQDRTICVRERITVDGFGPWTVKSEMHHVAPPFELLTRMVTLRVHLDDVPATNAPLLIAPGSQKAGRVPVSSIAKVVRRCGIYTCLAEVGDVWLYATPILHASQAATEPTRRRVLQVDFAAERQGGGFGVARCLSSRPHPARTKNKPRIISRLSRQLCAVKGHVGPRDSLVIREIASRSGKAGRVVALTGRVPDPLTTPGNRGSKTLPPHGGTVR